MRELKKLDKVAYIRFASVYRNFEDVDAFSGPSAKFLTFTQEKMSFSAVDHGMMARALQLAERGPVDDLAQSARWLRAGAGR
jgi:hypothetical protein